MSAPDPRLGNPEWSDNWTVGGGLRFEVMEAATRRVFIRQAEATATEVDSFEPPNGFGHALVGATRADMAFFARSPGAGHDGPVETVELGGRRFSHVARPIGFDTLGVRR